MGGRTPTACTAESLPLGLDTGFFRGNLRFMGGFLVPVIEVVVAILDIYWWLIIIQAVVSWLIAFDIINTRSRPVSMILDFLYRVTEPAIAPIRRFVPNFNGLDLAPFILLIIIWFIRMELQQLELFFYLH
jgi:YggT family protein